MDEINNWEDIAVPDEIIQKIETGKFIGCEEERKSYLREKINRFVLSYLFVLITSVITIRFFYSIPFIKIFDFPDIQKILVLQLPVLVITLILYFFSWNISPSKIKERIIEKSIENYQQQEYKRQQNQIRNQEDKERYERNTTIASYFNEYLKMLSDLITMAPYFSYVNWLKADEWISRGYLKRIYKKLGYKVEFYNYKSLLIFNDTDNEKTLIKYNNSASKPSVNTINKFLREKTVVQPNDSIFICIEECSEKAKQLAKSNGIRIVPLKKFILELPSLFEPPADMLYGKFFYADKISKYFNSGKKHELIDVYNSYVKQLRDLLLDLLNNEGLDEEYFRECEKKLKNISKRISELDSIMVDEEPIKKTVSK